MLDVLECVRGAVGRKFLGNFLCRSRIFRRVFCQSPLSGACQFFIWTGFRHADGEERSCSRSCATKGSSSVKIDSATTSQRGDHSGKRGFETRERDLGPPFLGYEDDERTILYTSAKTVIEKKLKRVNLLRALLYA